MPPPEDAERAIFDRFGPALLAPAPQRGFDGAAGAPARVAAGLAVYRNNIRAAFLRALEETFPAVRRLVGDGFFRYAAHEYFHRHPPRARLVPRYGDAFPVFLEGFEPARGLAYLPDVARLEIAWLGAYHAAEADALPTDEAHVRLACAPPGARATLHPSVRLFASGYPAHTLWRRNREAGAGPLAVSGAERGLFVRPHAGVLSFLLAPAPHAALDALSRGRALAEALETGLAADPQAAGPDIIAEIAALPAIVRVDIA